MAGFSGFRRNAVLAMAMAIPAFGQQQTAKNDPPAAPPARPAATRTATQTTTTRNQTKNNNVNTSAGCVEVNDIKDDMRITLKYQPGLNINDTYFPQNLAAAKARAAAKGFNCE